jgi:uncharacterized protein YndB with AHSA1/START domain
MLSDKPIEPERYRIVAEFDAPIEECFKAGTAEEAMMIWVPNIKSVRYDHSQADVPHGAGSFRVVDMKGGVTVIERVLVSRPPTLLVYTVEGGPFIDKHVMRNYRGHMNFTALGPNKTRLTWVGYYGGSPLLQPLVRPIIRNLIRTFTKRMKGYLSARGRALAA